MTRDHQSNNERETILVTGGAGYIGSHTVVLLLEQGYKVVVIDNCANAYFETEDNNNNTSSHLFDENGNLKNQLPESLKRVEIITNKNLAAFYKLNLVDDYYNDKLDKIFRDFNISAVIHFAALKSLSESILKPLEYYTNNLIGTINLLNCMKRHGCKEMIFSSSATVYGLPQYTPVDESHQFGLNVLNPYGRTKCMVEQILSDLCGCSISATTTSSSSTINDNTNQKQNHNKWNIIALRYFNPVGAHPSGHIGEHTIDTPNNLMPFISQVAAKKRDKLFVFGNDFDTPDGTGVRDYIHIMDLANGHIHALEHLIKNKNSVNNKSIDGSYKTYNLGTGKGYSVLEMINTFEKVNNVQIPYEIIGRRQGDAGEVYANAKLALKELNWSAKYSLINMCRDTFRWQTMYPEGFKTPMKQITTNN